MISSFCRTVGSSELRAPPRFAPNCVSFTVVDLQIADLHCSKKPAKRTEDVPLLKREIKQA